MYCKSCGNELPNENAVICLKCGSSVDGKIIKTPLSLDDKKELFSTISLLLAIVVLSVWHTVFFTTGIFYMYEWSFWLAFSLTLVGSGGGIALGVLSKNKLGYCLNTAAVTITMLVMLTAVII